MRNKTTVIQTPSVVTLSDPTSVAVSKDSREMVETAPVNICFVLCVLYAVSEIVILGKVNIILQHNFDEKVACHLVYHQITERCIENHTCAEKYVLLMQLCPWVQWMSRKGAGNCQDCCGWIRLVTSPFE